MGKRATIEISPYGELDLRIQAGQLLYADRPVVVFEGDEFQPRVTETGQKVAVYSASIPRKSKTIIGAFIKLTRPDGSFDFFWMLPEDIDRLKEYSLKKIKNEIRMVIHMAIQMPCIKVTTGKLTRVSLRRRL